MPAENILEVHHLKKSVGQGEHQLSILTGVELVVKPAQTIALIGESGSGKSTLLAILAGLDDGSAVRSPYSASRCIRWMKRQGAARAKHVGFVFQSFMLIPTLNALENVELPALLRGETDNQSRGSARALLEQLGLGKRLHHLPAQLSGGEQQVALARAFNGRPELLFADEPTGNLDRHTGDKIADLLFSLNREHGTTLIPVTHDPLLAARCDRRRAWWTACCGRKHDCPLVLARMALALAVDSLAGAEPGGGLRAGAGVDRRSDGKGSQPTESRIYGRGPDAAQLA
ncbi:ABC transporter ATP-binding protein [Raoultella planticola]|uniref:ABC transporter ATP-binding protein n=1 Tax=Raoultella planticola TaxID=575 RepID=A0A5P6AB19_RAOPL|nr:ABC transporter ATP-binding protein [Raoultella planticola]